MQPQIRDLQSIIAEQQKSIAPQKELIDQSIAQNEQSGMAQQAGLRAQQQQAFGQIEQGAQNKGMFFSGFTPEEQAQYTSTTYLPALAQLQATIAKGRTDLLGKKADLDTNVFDKATNMRENDIQVLRNWEKMTAEQQFQASQAEKQRVFDAQQNALKIAASARESAANRAASASASTQDPTAPFVSSFQNWMKSQKSMPSRQQQDAYINSLFNNYGIKSNDARQVVWNSINSTFKRNGDPTKDWTWKR